VFPGPWDQSNDHINDLVGHVHEERGNGVIQALEVSLDGCLCLSETLVLALRHGVIVVLNFSFLS
jgi:hypothetical protein